MLCHEEEGDDEEGGQGHGDPLPNLLALDFVIQGLLGEAVAASTRSDPQAESFGRYLRAGLVDVPEVLLG